VAKLVATTLLVLCWNVRFVVLRAHPVRGERESHIHRNATGEVATVQKVTFFPSVGLLTTSQRSWSEMRCYTSVLPTLQFSCEFGFVFFVNLKACGLLVFGLVFIKICLFFGLVFCRYLHCGLLFYQTSWPFCFFNLLQNEIWACFCRNLLILGLVFQSCFPVFVFN